MAKTRKAPPKNGSASLITKTEVLKKKALLEALKKTLGNITASCRALGISRRTFYLYMRDDPQFASDVSNLDEEVIDFVESKLKENINANDTACILFFLKTKGKKRGYSEKTETDINIRSIEFNIKDVFKWREIKNDRKQSEI